MNFLDIFRWRHKEKYIQSLYEDSNQKAVEMGNSAKDLRDLLQKDGVSLQILIATGGGRKRK